MSLLSHRIAASPGAVTAPPLTPGEIDAHPDADRIWATILRMRADLTRDPDYPSGRSHGGE